LLSTIDPRPFLAVPINMHSHAEHSSLYCLCNHLLRHLRVFSILTNSFSTQQESSLEDYVQLSVMLQHNYRC